MSLIVPAEPRNWSMANWLSDSMLSMFGVDLESELAVAREPKRRPLLLRFCMLCLCQQSLRGYTPTFCSYLKGIKEPAYEVVGDGGD